MKERALAASCASPRALVELQADVRLARCGPRASRLLRPLGRALVVAATYGGGDSDEQTCDKEERGGGGGGETKRKCNLVGHPGTTA